MTQPAVGARWLGRAPNRSPTQLADHQRQRLNGVLSMARVLQDSARTRDEGQETWLTALGALRFKYCIPSWHKEQDSVCLW